MYSVEENISCTELGFFVINPWPKNRHADSFLLVTDVKRTFPYFFFLDFYISLWIILVRSVKKLLHNVDYFEITDLYHLFLVLENYSLKFI